MTVKDYSKLKLVIWDLDDAFWEGTISEGEITPIAKNVKLVKDLARRGIVSSICSKNDMDVVETKLKELNLSEYFVFKSVNWTSKGPRVKQLLEDIHLRAANVLFIDDNKLNLNEVEHYSPDIKVSLPDEINELYSVVDKIGKDDSELSRLNNYHVLEEKRDASREAVSNEEFLYSCEIKVEIHKDIENQFARVHELINRTNQLNFTKLRINENELRDLMANGNYELGYVTATDRFGDYGVVGFYALNLAKHKLEHFLFSCRTIGMGVENYLYHYLDDPELIVEEPVAYKIDMKDASKWINSSEQTYSEYTEMSSVSNTNKVLIKGSCELEWAVDLLKTDVPFVDELGHVNPDTSADITSFNHSVNMYDAFNLSEDQKRQFQQEVPMWDDELIDSAMLHDKFDIIFLSGFLDQWEGVYERIDTGEKIALGVDKRDLTNLDILKKTLNKLENKNNEYYIQEQRQKMLQFSAKYKFIGDLPAKEAAKNFKYIISKIPKETKVVIFLPSGYQRGNTSKMKNEGKVREDYNLMVKEALADYDNVSFLDFTKFTKNDSDFLETQDHFSKEVYYEVAQEMQKIISDSSKTEVNLISKQDFEKSSFRNMYSKLNSLGLMKLVMRAKSIVKNKMLFSRL